MAKAQVGDLIRITDACAGEPYKDGDIFEVTSIYEVLGEYDSDVYVKHDGEGELLVCYDEYEVFRKAGEEEDDAGLARAITEVLTTPNGQALDVPDDFGVPIGDLLQDAVNSPNHYTQGRFETIEIIEEITKGYEDGYVAYCVGNALKYLARAPFKHGEPTEDLAKAERYLAFANAYLTQSTE